jgi:membrane-associated phospholipid phosphatase
MSGATSGGAVAVSPARRGLLLILGLHLVANAATASLAVLLDAPFVPWFEDTPVLLFALLAALILLGIAWDGSLVAVSLATERLWRGRSGPPPLSVERVRSVRFFSCGVLPVLLLLATGFSVLGTSNITLMSLKLLESTTQWRDAALWAIEAPLLTRLADLGVNVAAWDGLYHSAWGIQTLAAFALVVIGRGSRIILGYCLSFILLFYGGRLLGMLNPVMGPAFFQPEAFAYLQGSVTAEAMRLVNEVFAQSAADASQRGGILLGGVSAMPSLHVAMVAATAYWLAVAARWTLAITIPWVLAVWTSTVVLGWHYALDGAGGVLLAAVSIAFARTLLRRAEGWWPSAPPPARAASGSTPEPGGG